MHLAAVTASDLARAERRNAAVLVVLLPWQRRLRLALQVVPPLAAMALLLFLEAALAAAPSASGTAVALCSLAGTALLGACTALLQGGVYALAACLSPLHMQARATALPAMWGSYSLLHACIWHLEPHSLHDPSASCLVIRFSALM